METHTTGAGESVCRACLKLGAKKQIFSIHKPTSLQYSYILSLCASVQVNPDDKLPKRICTKCVNKIIKFYNFKNVVKENDFKLRQILKSEIDEKTITDALSIKNTDNTAIKQEEALTCSPGRFESKEKSLEKSKVIRSKENKDEVVFVTCKIDTDYDEIKGESFSESGPPIGADDDVDNASDISETDYNTKKAAKAKPGTKVKIRKTHQCDVCGKFLSCKSNLNQHIRKHTGERPYTCEICGKKFFKAEHVVIHKRTHTGERPYHCTICSKKFIQYAALNVHLRTHSGERPHMCSICGKSFSQSSSLLYHVRIHSGETPYVCNLCGKGFKNAGNLNIHKRFHDNERPFACKMCDKRFVTSSHLNVHIRQHNGIKSHQCIICGKAFVRSEHLKGHMVIHSGEKPHACHLCPKKYTQNSHLKRHMKSHVF